MRETFLFNIPNTTSTSCLFLFDYLYLHIRLSNNDLLISLHCHSLHFNLHPEYFPFSASLQPGALVIFNIL